MDGEVVVGDEEVDGVEVMLGALGKGVSPAHQAAGSGPQSAEPTLDVAGFTLLFAAATMVSLWERGGVGIPEVAAGRTSTVARWQVCPQITGTLQAAVTQCPSDDLAGTTTKGHPQPQGVGFAAHEAPEFIEFEHVTALAGQERVHEGGQIVRFFPPTTS